MRPDRRRPVLAGLAFVLSACGIAAAVPSQAAPTRAAVHHPIFMRTVLDQWNRSTTAGNPPVVIQPPAPPCPLPSGLPAGPCISGPQPPAIGQPLVGNMAYWGGHVQVHPHLYAIFFGWGEKGAFSAPCGAPTKLVEGRLTATLKCDPDGAGKRMADFVGQIGGTHWANLQSQYYQSVNGVKTYINENSNLLSGIWVDDIDPTSGKITYRQMAQEAERAAIRFKVPASQLINSNFLILQPQRFSDPIAQSAGYCAFHDLINGTVDHTDYSGLKPGIPYTNMPYVLNQGAGCGENLVNAGAAGRLDAFTVALGHEIEETATDPGAEDHINGQAVGGWYDPFEGSENGDKCAYVGANLIGSGSLPEPGHAANIRGSRGGMFPVQSLWSNNSAEGVGYCAGAGTDLPV